MILAADPADDVLCAIILVTKYVHDKYIFISISLTFYFNTKFLVHQGASANDARSRAIFLVSLSGALIKKSDGFPTRVACPI